MRRGEIWWAALGTPFGSALGQRRPVLIVQSNEFNAWRDLYELAREDATLRRRIRRIVLTVPLPLPRFWLAALASLGERVDWTSDLPGYDTEV